MTVSETPAAQACRSVGDEALKQVLNTCERVLRHFPLKDAHANGLKGTFRSSQAICDVFSTVSFYCFFSYFLFVLCAVHAGPLHYRFAFPSPFL